MKSEIVLNQRIACYDDGGKTYDRYTVVYLEQPENKPFIFAAVGMSAEPFHQQGLGQHCAAKPGKHLGRRIRFSDLPDDCKKLVLRDLTPEVN